MRTHRLGRRIAVIASLLATVPFVSAETAAGPDPVEALGLLDGVEAATASTPAQRVAPPTGIAPAPAFSRAFAPSGDVSGWGLELSDDRQSMTNDGTRVTCSVGGFEASTHYARLRRKLPEQDNFAPGGPFTIGAGIELPADFYSRAESYMRFITTDNYPGSMRDSGTVVGATSNNEWRVGFLIYGSDQLPRLVSEHQNRETIVLWKGSSRLPTGANNIEIDFTPSQGSGGAFEVSVNGQVVGAATGIRTVPTTLPTEEVVVTRVGTCFDGAAEQDSRRVTLHVTSFSFVAH